MSGDNFDSEFSRREFMSKAAGTGVTFAGIPFLSKLFKGRPTGAKKSPKPNSLGLSKEQKARLIEGTEKVDQYATEFAQRVSYGSVELGPDAMGDADKHYRIISTLLASPNKNWGQIAGSTNEPWITDVQQQSLKEQYGSGVVERDGKKVWGKPWITFEMSDVIASYQQWLNDNAALVSHKDETTPGSRPAAHKDFTDGFIVDGMKHNVPIHHEISALTTGYDFDDHMREYLLLKSVERFMVASGRGSIIADRDPLNSRPIRDNLVTGSPGNYRVPVFSLGEGLYEELNQNDGGMGKSHPSMKELSPGQYRHNDHISDPNLERDNRLNALIFYVLNDLATEPEHEKVSVEEFFSDPRVLSNAVLTRYHEIFNPKHGRDHYASEIARVIRSGEYLPAPEVAKEKGDKLTRLTLADFDGDGIIELDDLRAFDPAQDSMNAWRERVTSGSLDAAIADKVVAGENRYWGFRARDAKAPYLPASK